MTHGWAEFRRVGAVEAQQLAIPMSWHTPSGDVMRANAGDWLVNDDLSGTRTVTDASFRASHRHLGGVLWERCATVQARRAVPGETVQTREGVATAVEGDWLVRGVEREEWLVPGAFFTLGYAVA